MADRGRGSRGRGRFQQQPFPNRGRGDGYRGDRGGGGYRGDRGGGPSRGDRGGGYRGDRGGGDRGRGPFRGGGGGRGGKKDIEIFKQNGHIHRPKQEITSLEDETFSQSLAASLQQLSMKDQTSAPIRPAYGTQGRPITLWANYFELIPSKEKPFYRYQIDIIPPSKEEKPTGKKLERCVRLLLKELPNTIPIATDYKSTLVTPTGLPYAQKEFTISYYSENESGPTTKSPKYRMKVQQSGILTFEDLLEYLCSTDLTRENPATKEQIVQATNIILASGMKSNAQIITKRNKYFPAEGNFVEKWMLATGLEAFRGFFMSVRAATGRVLLNVQVQHVVVWEAQPMTNLLDKLQKSDRMKIRETNSMISGIWVQATHLNNRLKRVASLAQPDDGSRTLKRPQVPRPGANADEVLFWRTTPAPAQYITVANHFKQVHRPLSFPKAPVVNVGTKKDPIYMPSELCIIKKLQTYDKKLSPRATTEMVAGAVRDASDNAQTIFSNGLGLLEQNSEQGLREFGIKVNRDMVVVSGRVLPSVNLEYNKKTQTPRDASWNMMNVRFSMGAKLPPWSYLWIKTRESGSNTAAFGGAFANQDEVDRIVQDFYPMLTTCGMSTPAPTTPGYVLTLTNPDDPGREIDNVFSQIPENIGLLLVILPMVSTTIYNVVKRTADIKYGVHTVGVVAERRKFCKALFPDKNGNFDNKQYYANVALKINLKLGGQNQLLKTVDLGFVSEGKTMLVGLDVTHPAPGSAKNAPSVSSITASVDSKLGQWPADVAIQKGRQEMIEGLKSMFKSRLVLWQKHQGKRLPEEIIIYRDGVGETMYDKVRAEELPLIKEACKEIYPATETKANKPYITITCGTS